MRPLVGVAPDFLPARGWTKYTVYDRYLRALREAGLGQGATYENTLVFGDQGPIENRMRFPDEPVRHKLLDAIGDLALLGLPLLGRMEVHRGSHALHHALLRATLDHPAAWDELGEDCFPGASPPAPAP